jgi:hypothetical protein
VSDNKGCHWGTVHGAVPRMRSGKVGGRALGAAVDDVMALQGLLGSVPRHLRFIDKADLWPQVGYHAWVSYPVPQPGAVSNAVSEPVP